METGDSLESWPKMFELEVVFERPYPTWLSSARPHGTKLIMASARHSTPINAPHPAWVANWIAKHRADDELRRGINTLSLRAQDALRANRDAYLRPGLTVLHEATQALELALEDPRQGYSPAGLDGANRSDPKIVAERSSLARELTWLRNDFCRTFRRLESMIGVRRRGLGHLLRTNRDLPGGSAVDSALGGIEETLDQVAALFCRESEALERRVRVHPGPVRRSLLFLAHGLATRTCAELSVLMRASLGRADRRKIAAYHRNVFLKGDVNPVVSVYYALDEAAICDPARLGERYRDEVLDHLAVQLGGRLDPDVSDEQLLGAVAVLRDHRSSDIACSREVGRLLGRNTTTAKSVHRQLLRTTPTELSDRAHYEAFFKSVRAVDARLAASIDRHVATNPLDLPELSRLWSFLRAYCEFNPKNRSLRALQVELNARYSSSRRSTGHRCRRADARMLRAFGLSLRKMKRGRDYWVGVALKVPGLGVAG